MASIFSRLFKIGQSEAHSVVDKFEDPIKLTEQGIRDLKKDLQSSLESLAEVKAIATRMRREFESSKGAAEEYERKAMLLLQRAQSGQMDAGEAERLAREALVKKETRSKRAQQLVSEFKQQETLAEGLQSQVNKLKTTISRYENDLITLKARAKTAGALKKINRQLAQIDSSGTLAMLEKMKNKVEEDETLAAAYGEVVSIETSVDDDIDRAIAGATLDGNDPLLELKARMGLLPAATEPEQDEEAEPSVDGGSVPGDRDPLDELKDELL
ncbi:PspA/IM30 family protein [bacterium]|nr:PspA/IM30 family protein [candidate division CSSED10-310 bacterium]